MNQRYLVWTSFLLFLVLAAGGYTLANHKRVWNDEIYTQVGLEQASYGRIIRGKLEEGNNPPLYYVIQKAVSQLVGYRSPPTWHTTLSDWKINHPPSRLALRITPVIYMSLAITLIFYHFSRFYSLGTGLYSLFISFSSVMVWRYWAEARPYSLWVLLTTAQSLLFLTILRNKNSPRLLVWLIVVNFLLSLTAVFSITQIVAVSLLYWLWVRKDVKSCFWLGMLPCLICLYYYIQAPKYHFWFEATPGQLIRDCFSRERFYLLYIFLFYLVVYGIQRRTQRFHLYQNGTIMEALPYFSFAVLMLFAVGAILLIFKLQASEPGHGFPVSNRYFITLTPISIIAATLLTHNLLASFQDKLWMQVILVVGIGSLVVPKFFKTMTELNAYFPKLFS
jgi:uncharacterized membrane protein